MKINFNFGRGVAVVPTAVFDRLETASKTDIRVLFAISGAFRDVSLDDLSAKIIADKLGISEKQALDSIAFWEKESILEICEGEAVISDPEIVSISEKQSDKKVIVRRSDELPNYTSEQISEILSKRKETSFFLDECQREFGKIFNTHEINIVLGIIDYLGMEFEYVLTLLKHCRNIGKRTINYAEKLAFGFVDEGIDNPAALKVRIAEIEAIAQNESAVRTLFGMKARALTAKEKKFIALWFDKYEYNIEIVRFAYEIMIDTIKEPSMAYTDKILERWHNEGLKTIDEIKGSIDDYKKKKAQEQKSQDSGSFDTDDFFEAAIRRSYKDFKPE
jgi:DnaD/phage-associated family protein